MTRSASLLLLSVVVAACGAAAKPPPAAKPLPLDTFVADKTGYHYEKAWSQPGGGMTTSVLEVTSQSWRKPSEVDKTVWTHDVGIAVPDGNTSDTALVVLAGGGGDLANPPQPGDSGVSLVQNFALLAGTTAIAIDGIPDEPLTIAGQGGPRSEDNLVAATWDRVLATQDPTWSAYFPMTRAAIRCLDAAQDFLKKQGTPVKHFVVTGYSKRGAITYLVAAEDKRVIAMAPGVFDFLNFRAQAQHLAAVYATPPPAVTPYVKYDLIRRIMTPQADPLVENSDPYVYRARFTMPKLILASTGDQFFVPDAARYYLAQLPGETLVRYLPNTDHTLTAPDGSDTETVNTVIAWYHTVIDGRARPRLTWTHTGDILTLHIDQTPSAVRLWSATNPDARDFRRESFGPNWTSQPLAAEHSGVYVANVPPPAKGFTAFFIDAKVADQTYSTQIYVTPDK